MTHDEPDPYDGPPPEDGPPRDDARPEIVHAEIVPMDTTALAATVRTEVDAGLAWASAHPRSVSMFKKELRHFALVDPATAEKMYYSLRRGGKPIVGPSVRLAEVAAECYGNLRAGARILSTTGEYAIAEGVAHDLERNVGLSRTVARRLLDRNGRRYSDDMVVMTANAAGSLALRNAIVSVIGRRYLDPIVEEARALVSSKVGGGREDRLRAFEWWSTKHGVSSARILATLNRKGLDDVTSEDLADLKGIKRAIDDGDATLEDVFGREESLSERLAKRRGDTRPPAVREADRIAALPAERVQAAMRSIGLAGDPRALPPDDLAKLAAVLNERPT